MNKHVNAEAAGDLSARLAALEPPGRRWQAAFDMISQGVCFFDGGSRLIFANRRYAEIYRLPPDALAPGVSLREIAELRFAAGACPMAVEDYLAYCSAINASGEPRVWSAALGDGRNVRVRHQPTPDGGWISIHDDITLRGQARRLADAQISLQALIDAVPGYLWVKDCDSRYVVANRALAADSGRRCAADMIGLSDFDIHEPVRASEFRRRELDVILTGEPMTDSEELVIDAQGERKWYLSNKSPLRDARGEIVGLVGVAQDVTARRRADDLCRDQAEALDMIAVGGPTGAILGRLSQIIESQSREVVASFLRLDKESARLRHAAASNLPAPLREATEGLRVDAPAPAFAAALTRRLPTLCLDLAGDPAWAGLGDLAAASGLRACWATPILGREGEASGVLATFAREARGPSDAEARLAHVAGRMAAIAFDRERMETALARAKPPSRG